MGLLDLPSSAFPWADGGLAAMLPPVARIVVWGGVGAVVSMGLYWLLSPQQQLARIAVGERQLKITLQDRDVEMADGLAAAGRLLWLTIRRIGLILMPVLISAVPVVSLMSWLQTHYSYDLPPSGQMASVQVKPGTFHGSWITADDGTPRVDIVDSQGVIVHSVSIFTPIPIIHRRAWWNALLENPLGYLPGEGPVERVEIGLPAKQYLPVGPHWLRGWEALFAAALLAGSVLLKLSFRIR